MTGRGIVLTLAAAALTAAASAHSFQDPLITPVVKSQSVERSPMMAVTVAGARIVAVGLRGQIQYSDDNGGSWHQAEVPVTSDLVAVTFPTPREGWATGHGGIVLYSADGGASWVKQLDGKLAGDAALHYYERHPDTIVGDRTRVLEQAKRLADEGTRQPFLDIWFADAKTGWAVGTFNRIFRTDDGGATWIPLLDRTDNPKELHFCAVRGHGDRIYLVGEQGSAWRWDARAQRFQAIPTPYAGSLFGLVVTPTAVIAYGMRGSVFRSGDGGAHWTKLPLNLTAGFTGGGITSSGDIMLSSQAGFLVVSSDDGLTFRTIKLPKQQPIFGISSVMEGKVALVGPSGIRVETPR